MCVSLLEITHQEVLPSKHLIHLPPELIWPLADFIKGTALLFPRLLQTPATHMGSLENSEKPHFTD